MVKFHNETYWFYFSMISDLETYKKKKKILKKYFKSKKKQKKIRSFINKTYHFTVLK
jgi:hypothetical protein